jgi:hypothetical protein
VKEMEEERMIKNIKIRKLKNGKMYANIVTT